MIQPEVNRLLVELYRVLAHAVIAAEFPRTQAVVATRMIDVVPQGLWQASSPAKDAGGGGGAGARRPFCHRR